DVPSPLHGHTGLDVLADRRRGDSALDILHPAGGGDRPVLDFLFGLVGLHVGLRAARRGSLALLRFLRSRRRLASRLFVFAAHTPRVCNGNAPEGWLPEGWLRSSSGASRVHHDERPWRGT